MLLSGFFHPFNGLRATSLDCLVYDCTRVAGNRDPPSTRRCTEIYGTKIFARWREITGEVQERVPVFRSWNDTFKLMRIVTGRRLQNMEKLLSQEFRGDILSEEITLLGFLDRDRELVAAGGGLKQPWPARFLNLLRRSPPFSQGKIFDAFDRSIEHRLYRLHFLDDQVEWRATGDYLAALHGFCKRGLLARAGSGVGQDGQSRRGARLQVAVDLATL